MTERTMKFSVDVIAFLRGHPMPPEFVHVRVQLLDAATSAADNYRSASRGRSHAEFTARLGTVLDEIDEAASWLRLLHDADVSRCDELNRLRKEAEELRSIFVKSNLTARDNESKRRKRRRVDGADPDA